MSTNPQAESQAAAAGTTELSDFSALLKKEFKPKSDRTKKPWNKPSKRLLSRRSKARW